MLLMVHCAPVWHDLRRQSHAAAHASQEYKEAAKSAADTGIQLIPDESNIYVWKAIVQVRTSTCTHLTISA